VNKEFEKSVRKWS